MTTTILNPSEQTMAYVKALEPHLFTGLSHTDYAKRRLFVTISRAHYGEPTAAIIAFEGSPVHLSVVMTDLQREHGQRAVILQGRVLGRYSRRTADISRIVDQLLEDLGMNVKIFLPTDAT